MRPAGVVARAVVTAIVGIGASGPGAAFHSGGTAECSGCHSMHSANATGNRLLRRSDPSSTCLACHMDGNDTGPRVHHVATADTGMPTGVAPLQRTPGGDFGWLKKDYGYSVEGLSIEEHGSSHGHNIVAADYGFFADAMNTRAPGGTFSASQLACSSCHDPHGRYRRLSDGSVATTGAAVMASGSYDTSPAPVTGSAVGVYRLLAGAGYTTGGMTFSGVPPAVAPESYNRSEEATDTRVAYGHATGSGRDTWARWCATCHPQMLSQGHRADVALGSQTLSNYAAYTKSGDLSGAHATSYWSLVPFVENTADHARLAAHARSDGSALDGPASGDLVSCLTCHRAHASGWENMMRWDDKSTFLTYNGVWPGIDTTPTFPEYARGRSSAETRAAYYDRPSNRFATYQRTLCNKCHARD